MQKLKLLTGVVALLYSLNSFAGIVDANAESGLDANASRLFSALQYGRFRDNVDCTLAATSYRGLHEIDLAAVDINGAIGNLPEMTILVQNGSMREGRYIFASSTTVQKHFGGSLSFKGLYYHLENAVTQDGGPLFCNAQECANAPFDLSKPFSAVIRQDVSFKQNSAGQIYDLSVRQSRMEKVFGSLSGQFKEQMNINCFYHPIHITE